MFVIVLRHVVARRAWHLSAPPVSQVRLPFSRGGTTHRDSDFYTEIGRIWLEGIHEY